MSAAAAGADAGAPPPKGKKKLIIIVAAVLVLALGGVGAMLALKKPAAEEGEEEAQAPAKKAQVAKTRDPKTPPVFAPLDPFTVNLADKDADRYAQVGITLELDDPQLAETLKTYLPAVRNNILLLLSSKTSADLLAPDGKAKLAREVMRETSRGLGVEVEDEEEEDEEDATAGKKKKRKKRVEQALPVTAVYFSNFIIQ
jgi:flagellar protein FliL